MKDQLPLLLVAGLLVFREIYWARVTNKLIDKLMSRNYHEYKQAESQGEPERARPPVDEGPIDSDIGIMQEFGLR